MCTPSTQTGCPPIFDYWLLLLHHACSYYPHPAVVSYICKMQMLISFVTKDQTNLLPSS